MKRIFFAFFLIFTLFGCAKKSPDISKAINFTMISPNIRVSDAGFLHKNSDSIDLQVYNSGVSILELKVGKNTICTSLCKEELKFNEEFLKDKHYKGFLKDILNMKPIYNGENLQKTNCGFVQNISKNSIKYNRCNNLVEFSDLKNNIKIKLKELD